MKLISNEVHAIVKYGRIKIETRIGVLEYSYQTGVDYDANYELMDITPRYDELTDAELDEIDEIISNEIK